MLKKIGPLGIFRARYGVTQEIENKFFGAYFDRSVKE